MALPLRYFIVDNVFFMELEHLHLYFFGTHLYFSLSFFFLSVPKRTEITRNSGFMIHILWVCSTKKKCTNFQTRPNSMYNVCRTCWFSLMASGEKIWKNQLPNFVAKKLANEKRACARWVNHVTWVMVNSGWVRNCFFSSKEKIFMSVDIRINFG